MREITPETIAKRLPTYWSPEDRAMKVATQIEYNQAIHDLCEDLKAAGFDVDVGCTMDGWECGVWLKWEGRTFHIK